MTRAAELCPRNLGPAKIVPANSHLPTRTVRFRTQAKLLSWWLVSAEPKDFVSNREVCTWWSYRSVTHENQASSDLLFQAVGNGLPGGRRDGWDHVSLAFEHTIFMSSLDCHSCQFRLLQKRRLLCAIFWMLNHSRKCLIRLMTTMFWGADEAGNLQCFHQKSGMFTNGFCKESPGRTVRWKGGTLDFKHWWSKPTQPSTNFLDS